MKRMGEAFGKPNWRRRAYVIAVLYATVAIAVHAQTLTTLYSFRDNFQRGLQVQATDGYLYGTIVAGGAHGGGTIFKIGPGGTLTTLDAFCNKAGCTNGAFPNGLVQATNGDLYGTTGGGGEETGANGTVFKITASGTLTTLYTFCSQGSYPNCPDGLAPDAPLIQTTNGEFYGTTESGGANCGNSTGCGTIFRITPSGTLMGLYSFCSQGSHPNCPDGAGPLSALVQGANGDFYGITYGYGVGAGANETIFKITPSGTLTTLYRFCSRPAPNGECTDGVYPSGLVQATDGNFYGTTENGGTGAGCPNQLGCGTVFKITPSGTLTTLYSFCSQTNCADGSGPMTGLVQATDGNLYGTTYTGGNSNGGGTVFEITPGGTLTTVYSFCAQPNCPDGAQPSGLQPAGVGLVQDTSGDFYGTTVNGGPDGGQGTIFSLSVGLGPFVKTQTTYGQEGAAVNIMGTDLTGATSVTFNGAAATYTVVSGTLITTTVPAGATTGTVQVVTPEGTLASNVPYRVLP
jgi:uncharacterized repeat protein (TIGR03803 family)